jgi:hypothetical protein
MGILKFLATWIVMTLVAVGIVLYAELEVPWAFLVGFPAGILPVVIGHKRGWTSVERH